ncbi:hypothetical protein ES703_98273 [subsurface metagenome]
MALWTSPQPTVLTVPWKIIRPVGEGVGVVDKAIALGIRGPPVTPVVATYRPIQVEHVGVAAGNISLYGVIDKVVVVDLVIVGRVEPDSSVVAPDEVVRPDRVVVGITSDDHAIGTGAQISSASGIGADVVALHLVPYRILKEDFHGRILVVRDNIAGLCRATPDPVVGCTLDAHATSGVAPGLGASDIGANEVAFDYVSPVSL